MLWTIRWEWTIWDTHKSQTKKIKHRQDATAWLVQNAMMPTKADALTRSMWVSVNYGAECTVSHTLLTPMGKKAVLFCIGEYTDIPTVV